MSPITLHPRKPGAKWLMGMLVLSLALFPAFGCSLGGLLATPTPTATNTPTPTFTATPTDTATPTATPTVTPTPQPTATPQPLAAADTPPTTPTADAPAGKDYSGLVLTAQDIEGFQEIDADDLGVSPESFSQEGFTVETMFILMNTVDFEMIMGFTSIITSTLSNAGVELLINNPELMLQAMIGNMGTTDVSDEEVLPELTNVVGEKSSGSTLVANSQGIKMRADIVVFRRGEVFAMVIVMYLEGQPPSAPILDVAQKFDQRIQEVLAAP